MSGGAGPGNSAANEGEASLQGQKAAVGEEEEEEEGGAGRWVSGETVSAGSEDGLAHRGAGPVRRLCTGAVSLSRGGFSDVRATAHWTVQAIPSRGGCVRAGPAEGLGGQFEAQGKARAAAGRPRTDPAGPAHTGGSHRGRRPAHRAVERSAF